ncbi:MAG: hypothetical protein QOE51_272 [Actinoplanes sp.]|nr:hypothetical protein [Actinoplanes sp.]
MDETGHSGDTGAAESGSGADSHDHTLLNGRPTPESPWAKAARDPAGDVPFWQRPSTEIRPFAQRPLSSTGPDLPPGPPSGETKPPSGETKPPAGSQPTWSEGRNRYADLLAHLEPDRYRSRPDSLQSMDEQRSAPASAPPYPYEGDLDDQRSDIGQQRAQVPLEQPRPAFPAVRPAAPGGRLNDWTNREAARHALEPTLADGLPRLEPHGPADHPLPTRSAYDPSSFPRRLPYDPEQSVAFAPPAQSTTGYATPSAYSGFTSGSAGHPGTRPGEQTLAVLPQRVPAEPDVPNVPEPPPVEPIAETPALARIATHLRRGDLLPAAERQEGFDVDDILAAVREVEGVRDASLRQTPAGAHSLRLDLADGADPAEVSRQVARLLQDRMGLDAAMQGAGPAASTRPGAAAPAVPPAPPGFTQPSAYPGQRPVSDQGGVPGSAPDRPGSLPRRSAASVPAQSTPRLGEAPLAPGRGTLAGPVRSGIRRTETLETAEPGPTAFGSTPARPLEIGDRPGPRVLIENVQVNTFGTEAAVEVRLGVGGRTATGLATGPAVDSYLLRLCATATGRAIDELLSDSRHADGPAKCYIEHATSVPFGHTQVAVVVLLLSCLGWVEELAGSAVVTGDDARPAVVRATLAAVNRRLEALLSC